MISRLRKDAVDRDDPAPVVGKRLPCRPRKKGREWKLASLLPTALLTEVTAVIYGKAETLRVVWRDV